MTLPDVLTRISSGMFMDCTALKSVKIPESVNRIGSQSFYLCSSLQTITFPSSVKMIDSEALRGCEKLEMLIFACSDPIIETPNIYGSLTAAQGYLGTKLNAVVYGIEDSTVQKFAADYNFEFKLLSELPKEEPPAEEEPPLAPEGSVFCDANGDRKVTSEDAQMVLQYYVANLTKKHPTWYQITGNPNAPE